MKKERDGGLEWGLEICVDRDREGKSYGIL